LVIIPVVVVTEVKNTVSPFRNPCAVAFTVSVASVKVTGMLVAGAALDPMPTMLCRATQALKRLDSCLQSV
jgi:hypothetical protein